MRFAMYFQSLNTSRPDRPERGRRSTNSSGRPFKHRKRSGTRTVPDFPPPSPPTRRQRQTMALARRMADTMQRAWEWMSLAEQEARVQAAQQRRTRQDMARNARAAARAAARGRSPGAQGRDTPEGVEGAAGRCCSCKGLLLSVVLMTALVSTLLFMTPAVPADLQAKTITQR